MGVIASRGSLKIDPVLVPAPKSHAFINAKKFPILKNVEPGDTVRVVIDMSVENVNKGENSTMVDVEITDVAEVDLNSDESA